MMNWLGAIVIGVVIGGIGAYVLGRQSPTARWMAPVLSLVGAVIAAIFGSVFGHDSGFGLKRAALAVVLSLVGVGVAALLTRRASSSASRPVAS
jgi:uncharacterized membrane protein YeaQ/YmgE (transglycosylase-associated protein family)